MNRNDRLQELHNQGQIDASTSENIPLLGETNKHIPNPLPDCLLRKSEIEENDVYEKGFIHNKEQQKENSRVICTHFYRKGMLPQKVWRADMDFTAKYLSETTVRGYHFWAIPYVKLMRKSPLAESIMYSVAKWRAEELAYQMGTLPGSNFKGKLVRLVVEPICWLIGCVVTQKDWCTLYVQ